MSKNKNRKNKNNAAERSAYLKEKNNKPKLRTVNPNNYVFDELPENHKVYENVSRKLVSDYELGTYNFTKMFSIRSSPFVIEDEITFMFASESDSLRTQVENMDFETAHFLLNLVNSLNSNALGRTDFVIGWGVLHELSSQGIAGMSKALSLLHRADSFQMIKVSDFGSSYDQVISDFESGKLSI